MTPIAEEDIDCDLHLRDDVMLGLQNPTFEIMMQAFEVIDLRVMVVEGDHVKLTCRQPVGSRVIDINTPGVNRTLVSASGGLRSIH